MHRGASALRNSAKYFAITNLADGIDIFSLPSLDYYGFIAQNIIANNNETISLKFINDDFIAVGGMGGIQIYEAKSLRMISCLQEGSPSSTCLLLLQGPCLKLKKSSFVLLHRGSLIPSIFVLRSILIVLIQVSPHYNIVAGGAVNGNITIWEWKTVRSLDYSMVFAITES